MSRSPIQIQRDVIYALLLREVGSRFGRSRVGLLWTLVEPVAHLVYPMVLFGWALQRTLGSIEYPVFLIYGFLPFTLFRLLCLQTMDGTSANRGLLSYRQVLLMDVFIARALATCAVEAVVFGIVLVGLAMFGYDVVPPRPLEFAGALALAILLAFGLGLLFAAIGSVMPDARSVIRVIFIPLYFISGVLFPIQRFPDEWVRILAYNPLLHVVELTRVGAVANYEPMRYTTFVYPLALALLALFVGLALYRLRYLNRVTV